MYLLASEFVEKSNYLPVIDVRTPAEFEQGHIPNAFNIPLFSNEERAIVGTIYKKQGKEHAVQKGLELVGPKMIDFVNRAKKISSGKELLVHCWRGGMRSQSMVWLFKTAGMEAHSLVGGYKAYRAYNRKWFEKQIKLVVLGGYTGSGKTQILKQLADSGQQVVDLEGIAHHKGSAFGHIGELPQPTTEQFENNLAEAWRLLDFSKTVWVEDESKAIGHVYQPDIIYQKIRNAQVIFIDVPKIQRIKNLVSDYTGIDYNALKNSLDKIVRRLGNDNYKKAVEALQVMDYELVADISLRYYDKAYGYGVDLRNQEKVFKISTELYSSEELNNKMIEIADNTAFRL